MICSSIFCIGINSNSVYYYLLLNFLQALMPKDRNDWSPLSIYIKPDNFKGDDEKSKRNTIMFTMWQNTVQTFEDHNFTQGANEVKYQYGDLFQTWNPWIQPDPTTIVVRLLL